MIKRDGSYVSLWQDVESFRPQRQRNTKEFDVIIVGGGITGITTGLLLQKAGKDCLLVEAESLGFGTTSGTTAHLNTLLDTPYNQIEKNFNAETAKLVKQAAEEALQLIQFNISQYGIDCEFSEASAYLFARDNDQATELQNIFDACRNVGLSASLTDQLPINIPFVSVMNVPNQAKFHPMLYLNNLANEFEKSGGTILLQTRMQEVSKGTDGLQVTTTQGIFKSRSLVYATHIPPGINLLHLRCVPYRSYAVALQLPDENYPTDLCYDMYDPYHYYRTQYIKGIPYLIVGGEDHKTGHENNTENCFMRLIAHARNHFNVKQVVYQWSSQYFEPADGLPYIGNLPGADENIFVATGYGGNGMIYSNVAAQVLTSKITENTNAYKNIFNPSRLKPVAGFQEFIKHNADVAKQFIRKLVPVEKLTQLAELTPGEGRIVKFEDQSIGLSRDSDGGLHAISPICTHMKCTVQWNLAEQSWDCPCHGARYSPDGKVLTGPATGDLESIELDSLVEKNT